MSLATLLVAAIAMSSTSVAFAAAPEAPLTEPASEVTGTTAILNGVLNPNKKAKAGYHFAYSSGGSCEGNTTELVAEGSVKAIKVSATITGLTPHTTYTFCLVATNATGETAGSPQTFEALPVLAAIEEESAPHISDTSASLSALINPEAQETTCKSFQYVNEKSFEENRYESAKEVPCEPEALGSGSSGERATGNLTNLAPNTVYHYRVVAENGSGPSEGEDHNFLTLPNPPFVVTGQASSITPSSATISASVNPGSVGLNSDTTYFFEYGPTSSYGSTTPTRDAGQGESQIATTASLTGLQRDTIYHFRIVAMNNNKANTPQTIDGNDRTLMTSGPLPLLSGLSVSAVTQSSATITATLNSEGLPTRYELQLGATQGALQSVGSGDTASVLPLALNLSSLSPGTVYHFTLIATNINGSAESPEEGEGAFTTAPGSAASPLGQPSTPQLLTTLAIAFPSESSASRAVLGTKTTHLTNAQKLAKALKACRKKSRKQRGGCERQARKRYGTGKNGKVKKK